MEDIFKAHRSVQANINHYDKLVDFSINKIPFDHKTSKFPNGFNKSLVYAQDNPIELIKWLYAHQSQQGRKHFKNRLFIVLFNRQDTHAHWKLKAEIFWLKTIIDHYLENFNERNLFKLTFNNELIYSDIIWAVKN